jgi:hypothetical protein
MYLFNRRCIIGTKFDKKDIFFIFRHHAYSEYISRMFRLGTVQTERSKWVPNWRKKYVQY